MTLNIGDDFKNRWLTTPETVRQIYQDDLFRICHLLEPQTDLKNWLEIERTAEQTSLNKIQEAYATLKAELLEQARQRKQKALEAALAKKRAEQAEYAASLQQDEKEKFERQTQALISLRSHIQQEIENQTARYEKTYPIAKAEHTENRSPLDHQTQQSNIDTLRLRLELEAENLVEQAVSNLRTKLRMAAQDEIEYLLHHLNSQ